MPCSKNNKNNKNNKKQKYNCLTNSVSHCRNLNPPTPPTPPNPAPIYLTPEKYNVVCNPREIKPLQTVGLYNTLAGNTVIGETDKLLSLLFQNPNQSYSSNYIFEFKYNLDLAFKIIIYQAGILPPFTPTRILGTLFVGNKTLTIVNHSSACTGCTSSYTFNILKDPGTVVIDNTINKYFSIYQYYQLLNGGTITGDITQSGLIDLYPDILGYIEAQVGLPIKLPLKVPEELLEFTTRFQTMTYPISLTPRFYPDKPIDNFLYKIDADKIIITKEYIKENCLAKVTGSLNFKYAPVKTTTTVKIFAEIQRGDFIITTIKERIYKKTFTDIYFYNDDLFDNAKIHTVLEFGDKISFYTTITLDKSSQIPISGYVRDNLSFTVYKEL